MALSNPAGLESVGVALFGWGAVYGIEEGYSASIPFWGTFTTFGVLLVVVLPMIVASLGWPLR